MIYNIESWTATKGTFAFQNFSSCGILRARVYLHPPLKKLLLYSLEKWKETEGIRWGPCFSCAWLDKTMYLMICIYWNAWCIEVYEGIDFATLPPFVSCRCSALGLEIFRSIILNAYTCSVGVTIIPSCSALFSRSSSVSNPAFRAAYPMIMPRFLADWT